MREYVRNQFATYLKQDTTDAKPFNMERYLFNWTVRETRHHNEVPTWDNVMFKNRYRSKFLSIKYNLQHSNLSSRIISGEIKTSDIPFMNAMSMDPNGRAATAYKKRQEYHTKKLLSAKKEEETEDLSNRPVINQMLYDSEFSVISAVYVIDLSALSLLSIKSIQKN